MATPVQTAQMIRLALRTLAGDNAHHSFEHLCRHVAKRRIASNVLPATGPVSAGGDQGRDFETFCTYLADELPFAPGFLALASADVVVFACTIQREGLRAKFEDDIKSICARGTPVDRICIFATEHVPIRLRHDLQEWATRQYDVALEIFDGSALADWLAEPELYWIAQEYLHLPAELAPQIEHSSERLNNLPPRNRLFVGRGDELTLLKAIFEGGPAEVVAVHGLGGIGKSQLAQEYAHAHLSEYRIVWWFRARSQVELATDMISLGRVLGLDVDTRQEQAITVVRSYLEAHSDWLLVFDSADDIEAIGGFLPAGNGHLLITSRTRHWTGLARSLPLEEITPDEAIGYLRVSTGRDGPELGELALELGYLPLALAQAVGFVTMRGCSVTRYLDLYREAAQRILQQGPAPHGYPATVATTWLVHFQSLSTAAIEMLRLTAFLAPDAIPLPMLLKAVPADSLSGRLRCVASDPVEREAALGELVNASLLDRLDDDMVRVHVLVQEVTRAALSRKEAAIWTGQVLDVIAAAFPEEPWLPEYWQRASLLAPHAEIAAMRVKSHQTKIAYPAAQLLESVGIFLDGQGHYETAKPLLAQALALAEPNNTNKRMGEAHILASQGENLLHLGDYSAALKAAGEALQIYSSVLGPINPWAVPPLVTFANIAMTIKDYHGARERLEEALLIVNRFGEGVSGQRRLVWTMLGRVLARMGEFSVAQKYLDSAFSNAKSAFGPRHPFVVDALVALAELSELRGNHLTTEALLRESISIYEDLFGPDYPGIQVLIAQFRRAGEQ